MRVAYPSLSASALILMIASKEGYFKEEGINEKVRLTVRNGTSDAKILQPMIDEMKAATKAQRELKINDVFDFSFVRKANEELKASGWKP